jgi:hypothetical protein
MARSPGETYSAHERRQTGAITFTQPNTLTPDSDLLEYFCSENEQDSAHFR